MKKLTCRLHWRCPVSSVLLLLVSIIICRAYTFSVARDRKSFRCNPDHGRHRVRRSIYSPGIFRPTPLSNEDCVGYLAFTQILPFTFVCQLVFWGSFGRLFNLRQSKRVIGSVDVGVDIAQIIAFFSIPILIETVGLEIDLLFTIALFQRYRLPDTVHLPVGSLSDQRESSSKRRG